MHEEHFWRWAAICCAEDVWETRCALGRECAWTVGAGIRDGAVDISKMGKED